MRLFSLRSPIRPTLAAAGAALGFCALSTTALPASFTTLYTFAPAKDGSSPQAELTQGTDLKFYGTNASDGPNGNGSVFRINGDGGAFTSLSSFGPLSTGVQPNGGVIQASDGYFYGTTYAGGANGVGILFRITPTGDLTRLASFTKSDPGASPAATLVQGIDGFLYGTAQFGGLNNYGTVFRASTATGTAVTVSSFSGGVDGIYPESDLFQARDGNFYGTTYTGGAANAGTIFRVTPDGIRTTIYSFLGTTDGKEPLRGVVQGTDGYLYGIAVQAGMYGGGTIFRVATDGTLTVLYSFVPQVGSPYTSYARLLQASDGNFYGTTSLGGTFNVGAVFKVTPTGGFTQLYSFTNGTDGSYPSSGLVQGADGKLYGTTAGLNGTGGTIYRLDLDLALPAPQPLLLSPGTVSEGDTIMIKGDNFLGVTGVTFPSAGGSVAAAGFTVLSKTMLQAVVPTGAVTGAVTLASGVLLGVTPNTLTVNTVTTPPPPDDPGGGNPGNLPVVTIIASDPVAGEGGTNTGKFKFKRKGGDVTRELTVVLKIKGSAARGVDYDLYDGGALLPEVTKSVTFPANKGKVTLSVQVIDDALAEPDEQVVVKIKPGANYAIGTANKAAVIIADND